MSTYGHAEQPAVSNDGVENVRASFTRPEAGELLILVPILICLAMLCAFLAT